MSVATERELALDLLDAAIAAAAPGPATERAIDALKLPRDRPVWLYSFGKAATTMAGAAVTALRRGLHHVTGGLVVSPEAWPPPVGTMVAIPGDHPIPGRNSFTAAERVGEVVRGRMASDVVLVLVSGGASSLIAAPPRGIGESDLAQIYQLLLDSGLDISSMNAVRKRFSRWGGGRLAVALAPARTHCLIVSDVVGDDPSDIGSGPCVPDRYTIGDVLAILERSKLLTRLTPTAREYLMGVARGVIPDTPKRTHPAFAHVTAQVIAGNHSACEGVVARARELGFGAAEIAQQTLLGEAARRGAELARELIARRADGSARTCRVWGGEVTVTIEPTPGAAEPVLGGRMQELALSAARVLAEAGDDAAGITILASGTDGRDGPTNAAGACVDARTWQAIASAGIDPAHALSRHDAYHALDAAGALVKTGPTGTNVADVVIGILS